MRYELDAERGSGTIWADKSPAYIRQIPLILKHFPTGRILHIVRDVRDHCVSMRNAWGKDIRRSAWRWGKDVLAAHRQCMSMPERCLEVRFEELLQDPDTQMRRICLFLDLNFFAGLTELSQSVEQRGYAAGRTEIMRDNFRKFETRMTPHEVASRRIARMELHASARLHAGSRHESAADVGADANHAEVERRRTPGQERHGSTRCGRSRAFSCDPPAHGWMSVSTEALVAIITTKVQLESRSMRAVTRPRR